MADKSILSQLDYNQAATLFRNRRKPDYKTNTLFFKGDHWQDGNGYIGETPPISAANYGDVMLMIKNAFVSENAVKEVVEAHVNGVTGREPLWRFVPKSSEEITEAQKKVIEVAEAALTEWYNDQQILSVFQKAVEFSLLEEHAAIRPFILKKSLDANGQLKKLSNLNDALLLLRFEVLTGDKAGVYIDPNSLDRFGLYVMQNADMVRTAEITYIDDDNLTHLDKVDDRDIGTFLNQTLPTLASYLNEDQLNQFAPVEQSPLNLGGRLLMHEVRREPLINEQIRSLQKSLNLTWTMMMRNINLAGSRERRFLNAQRPTKKTQVSDPSAPGGFKVIKEDTDLLVGSGVSGFLVGLPIYDSDSGQITGYTNPNVSITDPISVATFTESRQKFYEAILGQAHQLHVTMSSEASASGKSRQEARAEFEKSLVKTKTAVDMAGRWLMEVALRFAANVCGMPEYLDLRCDFNCIVDAGAPDFNEREQNRKDYEAGAISLETLMSRNGTEDTDAEFAKIEQDVNYQLNLLKNRLETIALDTDGLLTLDEKLKYLGYTDDKQRADYTALLKADKIANPPSVPPQSLSGGQSLI